jgi:hypothetical protein
MLNSLKEIEGDEIEYSDSIMADCASDNSSNKAGLSEERMNHPEPMNEEYKLIRQSRNLQENARPKYRRRSVRITFFF